MADRSILFSGPMVCALLEGRKTQTRRVLKPQPYDWGRCRAMHMGGRKWRLGELANAAVGDDWIVPYATGDRLWVREAWQTSPSYDDLNPAALGGDESIRYAADGKWESWGWGDTGCIEGGRKRPGMFMPRWASRLTLTVTDVRVQRLQEICPEDARCEGHPYNPKISDKQEVHDDAARDWFMDLWDSLNAKRGFGWDANPWVAAYSFEVEKINIDQMGAA